MHYVKLDLLPTLPGDIYKRKERIATKIVSVYLPF